MGIPAVSVRDLKDENPGREARARLPGSKNEPLLPLEADNWFIKDFKDSTTREIIYLFIFVVGSAYVSIIIELMHGLPFPFSPLP